MEHMHEVLTAEGVAVVPMEASGLVMSPMPLQDVLHFKNDAGMKSRFARAWAE